MREIGLAGGAKLSFMLFSGEDIGPADQIKVVTGMMLFDPVENLLQPNHVTDYMKNAG
jgi:hypothetical protein